jgi:amino-acid N-acetyltransferase
LLDAHGLPTEGVSDFFPDGFVVATAPRAGLIVGGAGLEVHGEAGLLRSVVVASSHRGHGLAEMLVRNRLEAARARGLEAVYLLTTTAEAYFHRLGFSTVPRASAPPELRACREFSTICPGAAACLRVALVK